LHNIGTTDNFYIPLWLIHHHPLFVRSRSSLVGWGTALQVRSFQVLFLIMSLKFFIDIILLAALWHWGWLSLYQKWVPRILNWTGGLKAAGACGWQPYHIHVPIASKSGSLNFLEPQGLSKLVQGLLYIYPLFVISFLPFLSSNTRTCLGEGWNWPILKCLQLEQRLCSKIRLTYLLSSWSRVLLEKLTGFQLVKKFPAFYVARRLMNAFTSARHLSRPWASSSQSIRPHATSWS
jgi:hypothetical protein